MTEEEIFNFYTMPASKLAASRREEYRRRFGPKKETLYLPKRRYKKFVKALEKKRGWAILMGMDYDVRRRE